MADSGWVTQREAAELLGVHVSAVPKMVRRGDLSPRDGRPSIPRQQVVDLRAARAEAERERQRRRSVPRGLGAPRPPDDEHDWLLAPAASAVLGCTEVALTGRATRGQVPYTVHGGRRWFRLDLLELMVRAQVARGARSLALRRL